MQNHRGKKFYYGFIFFHLFTTFKRLFALTSQIPMFKLFRFSESLKKTNCKKWSQIWKLLFLKGENHCTKKIVFGEFFLLSRIFLVLVLLFALVGDALSPVLEKVIKWISHCIFKFSRATGPVLTSVREKKYVILPNTLNFVVRRGKLKSYTLSNPPEVFWKFARSGGYREWAVACFA